MITVAVSYPLVMDDSLGDPHQSTESRKRKVQNPTGIPNVVKLDIQGGHAKILVSISILIMKGMLWQWRIYWIVHRYPMVGRRNVELNFPLNCWVITLMMPFLFPRTVI